MIYTDPLTKLIGDWSQGLGFASIVFRILLTIIFSYIVGWERAQKRHSAGLRTFILIMLASSIGMMIDIGLGIGRENHIHVISGAIVIAIAIQSGNSMFYSSRNQIKGLTTAVGLWMSGIIGLAVGAGFYCVAIISFVALMFILSLLPAVENALKNKSNHFEVHLELKDSHYLQDFITTIRRLNLTIDDIELNPAYVGSGLSVYSISITIQSDELRKYKSHEEIIEALRSLDYVYHIEEIQ